MSEHEALGGRVFLSEARETWLGGDLRDGLCRCTAMANVISSLPRPTSPDQTIWDGFYKNEKLHDREPDAVVCALEQRWAGFWEGFPVRGSINFDKKKAFVGEWCRAYIRGGLRAFGKPTLRTQDEPDSDLVEIR